MRLSILFPVTAISLAMFLSLPYPGSAQSSRVSSSVPFSTAIDWEERLIMINTSAVIDPTDRNAPAAGHYLEQQIRRTLGTLVEGAVSQLVYDSTMTVGELLERHPHPIPSVQELEADTIQTSSRITSNLSRVEVAFELPLFPSVVEALYGNRTPRPLPRTLQWEPTGEFTGLVIMANRDLPVRGESQRARLQPALLPEILDTALEPVLTSGNVHTDALLAHGVVSYTTSTDPADWEKIVGPRPMRVIARELFGIYHTDIILQLRDARRLLSTENNRQFLAQGRVLVIVAPE